MRVHLKRSLFLLLMLALLVSLLACAASNTFTQAECDAWVARCITDYEGLYQKNAMHYSKTLIYQNGGDERVLSNTQVWFSGSNSLEEHVNFNEMYTHTVSVNGDCYRMEKKGNANGDWIPQKTTAQSDSGREARWEDKGYQLKSIQNTDDGINVSFLRNKGHDNCTHSEQTVLLTFCYQSDQLVSIVYSLTSYKGLRIAPEEIHSVTTMQYTFYSTEEEVIGDKIMEAYKEATELES